MILLRPLVSYDPGRNDSVDVTKLKFRFDDLTEIDSEGKKIATSKPDFATIESFIVPFFSIARHLHLTLHFLFQAKR
jgi:flagellar biosynthesis/type III secretory pathway M-ring protein FliF/YscJ